MMKKANYNGSDNQIFQQHDHQELKDIMYLQSGDNIHIIDLQRSDY